jgi:hypothetical protein
VNGVVLDVANGVPLSPRGMQEPDTVYRLIRTRATARALDHG